MEECQVATGIRKYSYEPVKSELKRALLFSRPIRNSAQYARIIFKIAKCEYAGNCYIDCPFSETLVRLIPACYWLYTGNSHTWPLQRYAPHTLIWESQSKLRFSLIFPLIFGPWIG